jgi:arabinan endo-1,5-alpha-L-arabinosidase
MDDHRQVLKRATRGILAGFCVVACGVVPCQGQPGRTNAPADDDVVLARLGRRDTRVHDPSTILPYKDEYWVYATGMGILSRHSKDLIHWTNGPAVFAHPPSWTTNAVPQNRGHFWAPDVICVSNRYLLYYSVSTFGKNTSAIGMATNHTLNPDEPGYAWVDEGPVIQSSPINDFNTIDPSVMQDENGGLWLAFGSFWSGIKLIQLDPATGKRIAPDSPIYPLAHSSSIEAACLYRHDNHYFLFVNWGTCCRGVNSTYNIRVGRSAIITGPYLDREGKDLLTGGGTLVLGTEGPFIGPGHAGILCEGTNTWLSCHFYDGTRYGAPTLALLPLRWSTDGWPEVITR